MNSLFHDLKYACRTLAKQPLFTLLVVGILALGIAGTTTMFSIYNAVCLRPLPIPHPERAVNIYDWSEGLGLSDRYTVFENMRNHNTSFEYMAAMWGDNGNLLHQGQVKSVSLLRTTPELFELFGIHPIHGRCFSIEDDHPEASVALLSSELWHQLFKGDESILSRVIQLDDRTCCIIGVLPKNNALLESYDLWVPLAGNQERNPLFLYGRLKPGIDYKQAQQDLSRFTGKPNEKETNETACRLAPVRTLYTSQYQRRAILFFGAVVLVLLIACFNVSGLLLARSTHRNHELSICAAIGATPWRIMRQLLTESLVIVILGTGLGLLWSQWILGAQIAFLSDMVPHWVSFTWDGHHLIFCLGVVVGATILAGVLPAWHAGGSRYLHNLLQSGKLGATATRGQQRSLHTIVVCELALALTLLIGAGLLWQSYFRMQAVDPGYRKDNLLAYRLTTGGEGKEGGHTFYRDHIGKVRALPGVKNAALVYDWGAADNRLVAETGRQYAAGEEPTLYRTLVWPGYLNTMGVKLLAGRSFTDHDMHPGGEDAIIVNERLATRYWPQQNPIGQRIHFTDHPNRRFRIVGMTRDVRQHNLDQPPEMEVYVPYNWDHWDRSIMRVVVHTSNSCASMTQPIQQIAQATNPSEPPPVVHAVSEHVADMLHDRHMFSWPFYVFAVVAGILAIGGIFGVMSYAVSQKTQEIGVRLALGARPGDIIKQILGQGAHLIGFGLLFGIFGGLILSRILSASLFGVSETDPRTYLAVCTLLAVVTLLACYIPARQAAKIDPMEALRYE
ncbi:ABC transporter permease [Planctomycetota bacterium]